MSFTLCGSKLALLIPVLIIPCALSAQSSNARNERSPHETHPGHDHDVLDRGQVADRATRAKAEVLSPEPAQQAPGWWYERGVLTDNVPLDYAVINQGQIKNLAAAAAADLLENLPQGLSPGIWQMIDTWQNPSPEANDFIAINQGQLKNVAMPFYDRLMAVGYWTGDYPWIGTGTPNHYALANIGQAKMLFSFDVSRDSHDNGLPDWWEVLYWPGQVGQREADDPTPGEPDNTDLTLLDAFREGRNPLGVTVEGSDASGEVGLKVFIPR